MARESAMLAQLREQTAERLLQLGLAIGTTLDLRPMPGIDPGAVRLFVPLIEKFKPVLRPVFLRDCPVSFYTALLKLRSAAETEGRAGLMTLAAGGQGQSPGTAALACLGELAERVSLFSEGTQDLRVFEKSELVEDLPLGAFLGFSGAQEQELLKRYPRLEGFVSDGRIDWNRMSRRRLKVTNLRDGRQAQVPAFGILFGEEGEGEHLPPAPVSSSGTAVWSNLAEAARRALQELAERDAFAQVWYNRVGITRLNARHWPEILSENVAGYLLDRPRSSLLLRVDTDLATHVVAAVSYETDGLGGCLGVSAAASVKHAALSAVYEMLQAEFSLELAARVYAADCAKSVTAMPSALAYASSHNIVDDLRLQQAPECDAGALQQDFGSGDLEASCHAKGIDLWRLDASRMDLGVPCVKILSPHLCSLQPRFGKRRLFSGVVERRWRDIEAREEDFSQWPYPF